MGRGVMVSLPGQEWICSHSFFETGDLGSGLVCRSIYGDEYGGSLGRAATTVFLPVQGNGTYFVLLLPAI